MNKSKEKKCTLENLRHAPSGINLLRIIPHPSVVLFSKLKLIARFGSNTNSLSLEILFNEGKRTFDEL